MTKVTYHTIATDEFKAGDCAICTRCGATLKNYAKIDGQVYGLDCAAVVLGKKESQVKRSWEHSIKLNRKPVTFAEAAKQVANRKPLWKK